MAEIEIKECKKKGTSPFVERLFVVVTYCTIMNLMQMKVHMIITDFFYKLQLAVRNVFEREIAIFYLGRE